MKTQKPVIFAASIGMLASLAGVGCDAQAGHDYKGEALLSVKGAIQVSEGASLTSDAVPVLAWDDGEDGDFTVMAVQDLEVSGDFPGQFELSVMEPPSEEVLSKWPKVKAFPEEPRVAYAFIGALPEKHDAKIFVGTTSSAEETCVDGPDGSKCEQKVCDRYGKCFTETTTCTGSDAVECTTTSDAAPALENGLGVFTGIVDNYIVVYFEQEAKQGSLTAWRLGVDHIDAGYHLVQVSFDDEEPSEEPDCVDASQEAGAARFEKATGKSADEVNSGDDEELLAELDLYQTQVAMEMNCTAARNSFSTFAPLDRKITMTLGDKLVSPF